MGGFLQRLKAVFSRKEEPPPAEAMEEFRRAFRARCHAFKLLLNANNTALQLMAEMATTLHGQQSFGMTFVRSHATAVCVNVFSLIRYLNELAGGKYQALAPVFEDIRGSIEAALEARTPPANRAGRPARLGQSDEAA